jgi:hypothetical protein
MSSWILYVDEFARPPVDWPIARLTLSRRSHPRQVNRKIAMENLITFAAENPELQFIFLTPQDLRYVVLSSRTPHPTRLFCGVSSSLVITCRRSSSSTNSLARCSPGVSSTLKSARDHCSETQGIDLPRDFIKVNSMEAPRP